MVAQSVTSFKEVQMLTLKGEITKEDLLKLIRKEVAKELDAGLFDFNIEGLKAEDIYENTFTSDFVLKFTVKKK